MEARVKLYGRMDVVARPWLVVPAVEYSTQEAWMSKSWSFGVETEIKRNISEFPAGTETRVKR